MNLRTRCARFGAHTLADAELLALLLGQPTLDVPLSLLSTFGGLRQLNEAGPAALRHAPGVGSKRSLSLSVAIELGRRAMRQGAQTPAVLGAEDAYRLLYPEMAARGRESLWALYLSRRRTLLSQRCLTTGNDAHTIVDPRQVLRPAVQLGAAAVIVAHNHPSGAPEPSPQDILVTRRLLGAAEIVGVEVLDHIIIGAGCYVSLAERRLLVPTRAHPTMMQG